MAFFADFKAFILNKSRMQTSNFLRAHEGSQRPRLPNCDSVVAVGD